MADPKSQQDAAGRSRSRRGHRIRFSSEEGIQAEDRRSEGGRRTGGAHAGRAGALADQADRHRRRQVDRGDHRAAGQEADRADQPDPAPPGLPEARRRVARAALSRQQHRDRRDAEDPLHEHQQAGSRQDAEALQGHGLGSEPAVQEGLRGGVRAVRRRAVRLPGRRLLLRPDAARRGAARRDVEGRRRGAHAVHRRRVADGHADGHAGRSWPIRAT